MPKINLNSLSRRLLNNFPDKILLGKKQKKIVIGGEKLFQGLQILHFRIFRVFPHLLFLNGVLSILKTSNINLSENT